jgi:hypothetical protein
MKMRVGTGDKITMAIERLDVADTWNAEAIQRRQDWYADVALDVWNVRNAKLPVAPE